MSAIGSMGTLSEVPSGRLSTVLQFLDEKEQLTCARVCKAFRAAVEHLLTRIDAALTLGIFFDEGCGRVSLLHRDSPICTGAFLHTMHRWDLPRDSQGFIFMGDRILCVSEEGRFSNERINKQESWI